MVVNTD